MIEYVIGPVVALIVVAYGIRSDFQHYALTSTGVYKRIKRYDVERDIECIECGESIGDGELRTASKEIVVLGCPIYTTDSVENHYCEAHSSFEYRQGETVQPTKDRLAESLGRILGIVSVPTEKRHEPQFKQLESSISASFHLVGIAFVVLIASFFIAMVKGLEGEI